MHTINCKGKIIVFEKPLIMGILNITPDSFYKGFLNYPIDKIEEIILKMIQDGADIIDIGGQSSKPNSSKISEAEELKRVIPIIRKIIKKYPEIIISIDTFYSKVAKAAIEAGASIVNDISAGNIDNNMIATVAKLKVPYICMHMQGTPANMQINPQYNNINKEILDFFISKIAECKKAGIVDIIIDPGFGFGKSIADNFNILKNLATYSMLNLPILVGLSRKSFIYKTLQTTPNNALNGTSVLHTIALQNKASILRVHDVKQAKEVVALYRAYNLS